MVRDILYDKGKCIMLIYLVTIPAKSGNYRQLPVKYTKIGKDRQGTFLYPEYLPVVCVIVATMAYPDCAKHDGQLLKV
jgi:hypothetical protein